MENVLLMTFEHAEVDIQAGTETAVQLNLRNWGECRMTYHLLSGCIPKQWVEIVPSQVRVNAGGEVAVTVGIKVPADARVAQRTIVIHAIDPFTELECGHAMLKLPVNTSPVSRSPAGQVPSAQAPRVEKPLAAPLALAEKLAMNLAPTSQSSTGPADYSLSIMNADSHAVALKLEARDESNLLALAVDPSHLILGPHQLGTARVQVKPISPLPDRTTERLCMFVVSARAADETMGSTQGTLLQTRPPSSAPGCVWISSATGAVFLLLLCFVLNFVTVQEIPPAASSLPAPTVPVPANAPPITDLSTVTPPPTAPSPTNPPQATATPLPLLAITNLVTNVEPTTSTICPTSFDFSAQITASGPGEATYYWEFSDGATTTPAAVTFKRPDHALVQTAITLTQSTDGWGRVHVTSPTQLTSNQATYTLGCAAPTP